MACDAMTGAFSGVWCRICFFIEKLFTCDPDLPGRVWRATRVPVSLLAGSRRQLACVVGTVVISRWEKLLGAGGQTHVTLCRRAP